MLKSLRRIHLDEQWENTVISPVEAKTCTVSVVCVVIADSYKVTDLSA